MNVSQIDELCQDWLRKNYDEKVASEYTIYSLVIPTCNSPGLNEALEDLKRELRSSFGPKQSFGNIDYHEARKRLGLPDKRTPVPGVFFRAFAKK
jgi:hypothetical protein